MAYRRSGAVCELFRPFSRLGKAEYWLPRWKSVYAVYVTVLLSLAVWAMQLPAGGQVSARSGRRQVKTSVLTFRPTSPAANDDTWTNNTHDDRWSTNGNWSTGKVPDKTSDVMVNSGPLSPSVDVNPAIHTLTLKSGTVRIGDGFTLTIYGDAITNNKGQLELNANTSSSELRIENSSLTLSGTGTLYMSDSSNNDIVGKALINNLTAPADIEGAGNIGRININLKNIGTINASYADHPLTISGGNVENMGVLESTNGDLVLEGIYTNSGSIAANGGYVELAGCTIQGGTLNTSSGGVIKPTGLIHDTVLDGITNEGLYQMNSRSRTILKGTITNNGEFQFNDTNGTGTTLTIEGTVTIKGTGTFAVAAGSENKITGGGHFVNKETIEGPLTFTAIKISNAGTIQNLPGTNYSLTFKVPTFNNSGSIGTNGGPVNILGPGTLDNHLGNINTDNLIVADGQPMIVGGNITGSGTFEGKKVTIVGSKKDISPTSISAVTNAATFLINAGDTTTFEGALVNNGTVAMMDINCNSCLPSTALISGSVALSGMGTWSLAPSPGYSAVIAGNSGSDTLINSSKIQGTGVIGNNSMNLVNAPKGQIIANSSLPLVLSMGPGNLFTNGGSLLVAAITGQSPSVLSLTGPFANFNPNTGTLTGGMYNISGNFQFDNANIVTNAANITLFGQIVNQNNVNGLANFANNAATGIFNLTGENFGSNFTSAGPFTNAGKLVVGQQGTFIVGGSGTNYNQTGGTTTVDGKLEVSTSGLIDITGGTLKGGGKTQGAPSTLSGSVSLGNQMDNPATFVIGDSAKTAGLISIANDYTQLSTGAMDVQISGTTAGSQYSQLNVTGTVNLNGTLNIKRVKFLPKVGDTFTILTGSAVSGQFATVNGLRINSSEHFQVSYPGTSVVLTVVLGPAEEALGAGTQKYGPAKPSRVPGHRL